MLKALNSWMNSGPITPTLAELALQMTDAHATFMDRSKRLTEAMVKQANDMGAAQARLSAIAPPQKTGSLSQ